MVHFPNSPLYQDVLRLIRLEGDIADLEIEGSIPTELDGAFYRVHPDPQFAPKYDNDQFFNGDGMVSMFRFKEGKVSFRQRYAKTEKWKRENEAGHALFGAYRNPLTDDPSVKGVPRGTANTNVLVHAGKLFAMKEDSPCLIMDKDTLETDGYTDFDGDLEIPTFSAHPKIDHDTGNFCGFGYATKGDLTRDASYFEISPEGKVVRRADFQVPYYTMLHDFAIAGDYAVFNVSPYSSDWETLRQNRPHFWYDRSLPFYLGVMRRDGDGSDIRWFKQEPSVCGCHVMNAYQDGTQIYFDLPVSKTGSLPFFPEKGGTPFDPVEATTFLNRFKVDLASNSNEIGGMEKIGQMPGEFPRIDDRMAGKPYRHGWMITYDFDKPYHGPQGPFVGVINSLTHYDHATGEEKSWWCGPDGALQEPCFVPRSKDADEGDGWLVALVDNHITNYSDLCIFEAMDVAKGPIARIKLPLRLRQGLHGNWADGDKLAA
ncbi:lignostilbene alpha-beta-dioxygenase [Altererythrobacter indicus]|uniref:Dioxygenase n=1 Tax=Altericroceibacterium indicum TaxID=374177 RepID=A0A845A8A0_9SPHN|nr:carotenoid oxygenase family protein [Altericroceibacterium indicum]MXP26602.1 lignostilbene alpha-beta-dioxygenase [Altericroceibacterium indicum]